MSTNIRTPEKISGSQVGFHLQGRKNLKRKGRKVEDAKNAKKRVFLRSLRLLPWRPLRLILFFPDAQLKYALIRGNPVLSR
jgi:hypothetical protein